MNTDRELMQRALDALEFHVKSGDEIEEIDVALITALRERLAQPEQKPFCYHDGRNIVGKEYAHHCDVFPLYTHPAPQQIGQGDPVAWKWRNIKTDSEGVHLEDPKTVGIDVTHPAYEWTPLYTHPAPQQKPLTDEQIGMAFRKTFPVGSVVFTNGAIEFARAIEAAHSIGEKK